MKVLDLFSGIGGMSLGLERAGMRTVAFCECDPFCRRVLAKHWPHVPCYEDIRGLTAARLTGDGIGSIDVMCGGFPCQDISLAGTGAGISGARSRLWFEFARLVREVRPDYVIVENTAALLTRGLGSVLGDLAAVGMDAEWHCIPAAAVGADHIRDRTWIVAYADRRSPVDDVPHGLSEKRLDASDVGRERLSLRQGIRSAREKSLAAASPFAAGRFESSLVRGVHGIPYRVDRVKSLGNAVVPQIPEIIGRAIMTRHHMERAM